MYGECLPEWKGHLQPRRHPPLPVALTAIVVPPPHALLPRLLWRVRAIPSHNLLTTSATVPKTSLLLQWPKGARRAPLTAGIILIVDDEPSVVRGLQRRRARDGYIVDHISVPPKALSSGSHQL